MYFDRDTHTAGWFLSLSLCPLDECMSLEERKEKTKKKRRIKHIDEFKMTAYISVFMIRRNDP
jgi:hypothetical protein